MSGVDGARRSQIEARVRAAVEALARAGEPVTFYNVAQRSEVGRSTLYRRADLRALVEAGRAEREGRAVLGENLADNGARASVHADAGDACAAPHADQAELAARLGRAELGLARMRLQLEALEARPVRGELRCTAAWGDAGETGGAQGVPASVRYTDCRASS